MKKHLFKLKPSIHAEYNVPRIMCNGMQRCHYGIASRYWHNYAKYRKYHHVKAV